jgi:hypothetical protein
MANLLSIEESDETFYHSGRGTNLKRAGKLGSGVPLAERQFIAWDGESGSPHGIVSQYHLFLAYTPDGPLHIKAREGLTTSQCLQFIVDVEEEYPDAVHVWFGSGYDVNMILSTLNKYQLEVIHKTGILFLDFKRWRLEWRKGKSLTITRYNGDQRTSIVLYDVWHFFMTSLVVALEQFGTCPLDELEQIREGKARRGTFTYEDIESYVLPYCAAECRQLIQLMNHFRELLYSVGFTIRHWHGPGAIASFLLRYYNVHDVMAETPEAVRLAAQYAYAAGRFELPKVGASGPLWSVDINSAYPEAIAELPDLSRGEWRHVERPTKIARFGVYRIKSTMDMKSLFTRSLAPLFHRDSRGRISFPWITNGWYWSPETALVFHDPRFDVAEGWVWVPLVQRGEKPSRPFTWVKRMYDQRLQWKREGNQAQYPLKLALNSLYGKFAQRVGWDKVHMKAPPWHQLEWAGWVTSFCRAKIYRLAVHIGLDTIVAIETDGLYTTRDPTEVGLTSGEGLGELKIERYDDGVYVQNGLAWLAKNVGEDRWEMKYRGLDPESLPLASVLAHLCTVDWSAPLRAQTTRFIGIGAALVSRDWRVRWRVWETIPRSILVGGDGKRIHVRKLCRACKLNANPLDMLHDLLCNLPQPGISAPHPLPWIDGLGREPPWRALSEIEREMIPDVF